MEAEAEAPPVERLHQRVREVRLSLEPQEFSRDLGRRSEITPERRVQFRPNGGLTPREVEHGEGSADEELEDLEGMDILSLQRALRASRIRTTQMERTLREERRRSSMASTPGREGELGTGPAKAQVARPKLNNPHIFKGEYTETYNAYNWLHQVFRYLTQCKVPAEDYSAYARTYMSEHVQSWMDAEFGHTDVPEWNDFYNAVIARYVPPDHDDRLERMFAKMRQRDTLLNYIEQWQVLESALEFSHVHINTRRKIMGFIEGMKERDDKYRVIQAHPATLQAVFSIVHDIRRAKILTKETKEERTSRTRVRSKTSKRGWEKKDEPKRHFNKLEGAAKKRAWDEGACLNCGGKDHFIGQCPKLKSDIKSAAKKYAALFSKGRDKTKKTFSSKATAGSHKKLHRLTGPAGTQKEEDNEENTSSEDNEEVATSDESATTQEETESEEEEENSCPESEG
jgi:hypothetical protein